MRILIVAEARLGAGASGAERVLEGHVAGLLARGHDLTVLCARVAAVPGGGRVTAHEIGWSPATPWRARRAAAAAIAGRAVDAIVTHHPLPAALLVSPARRARVPIVAVVLSTWHEEFGVRHDAVGARARLGAAVRRRLERRVLTRVDRVCAMSRFMRDRVAAAHGLPAATLGVVPGGVDRERFRPADDRAALRRRLALPEDAPVLFCLRNLEPRMGVDLLIDAMPALRAAHPSATLVVGGDGPLAATLRARAASLRLGDAVRFTGFIPEEALPAYFAASDASVVPTRALEGFGLITLESLACGTPVIGTPVGGTPELLAPLDPALLADAATADALARALAAFLRRPDQEALRARSRAHTAGYARDRVAALLEAELRPARA